MYKKLNLEKKKKKNVNWLLFDILQSDWPEKSIPTSIVIWPTLPTHQVWGSLIKGNLSYHKKTNVWCPPNLTIRFHLVNKLVISENIIVNWLLFDILQSDWPEKSIPTSIVIWPTLPTHQVWGSLIKGNLSYHKKLMFDAHPI